jgi:predicted component of type VI protein secretion system
MKQKTVQWVTTRFRYGVMISLCVVLAACASAPVQEMSDARQAVEAAVQSGAATTAPTQMTAAQNALRMAERLLRDHQFSAARHYALAARKKALEAQQISLPKPDSNAQPTS